MTSKGRTVVRRPVCPYLKQTRSTVKVGTNYRKKFVVFLSHSN